MKKIVSAVVITAALVTLGSGIFIYNKSTQGHEQQEEPLNKKIIQPVEKPKEVTEVADKVIKDSDESTKNTDSVQVKSEPAKVATNAGNQKFSWYYKPNKEHKLPEVNQSGKALLEKYNGIYYGDLSGKNVYLTFDEGYENGYTPKILDVLKESNVKAAFFITGDYIRRNPELVKRMVAEGHIVGNHTDNHPSLPTLNDAKLEKEILSLSDAFNKLTGGKMSFLRPPMGEYSERTLKITHEMGYRNVFWSVALVDWRPEAGSPKENKSIVHERIHDGAVILLHAVNKANSEMLHDLITECRANGYRFGSLSEIK